MIQINELGEFDLSQAPLASEWKGPRAHIGPAETVTPLVRILGNKSKLSVISMMAGVSFWAARRLEHFTDVSHLDELIEASFAWHFNFRYLDPDAEPDNYPPANPPELSALMQIDTLFRSQMENMLDWTNPNAPIFPAFHLTMLVQHILPDHGRALFQTWLEKYLARIELTSLVQHKTDEEIDAIPRGPEMRDYCAMIRGKPLPPSFLDVSLELDGRDLEAEALANLKGLDHTKNRFLRSPSDMLAMGFKGDPYGVPS